MANTARPSNLPVGNQQYVLPDWANYRTFSGVPGAATDLQHTLEAASSGHLTHGHLLLTAEFNNATGGAASVYIGGQTANARWVAGQWDHSADPDFYVDDTTDAQDAGASDFVLQTQSTNNDGFAIGSTRPFNVVVVDVGTAAAAAASQVDEWTYWNGSSYATLDIVRGTPTGSLFGAVQEEIILFDPPSDWAKTDGTAGEGGIDSADASSATQSSLTGLYVLRYRATTAFDTTSPLATRLRLGTWRFMSEQVPGNGQAHYTFENGVPLTSKDEALWVVWDTVGTGFRSNLGVVRSKVAGLILDGGL